LVLCLLLVLAGASVQAGSPPEKFEPLLGQSGKDVIWLPTAQTLAEKMLDLGNVGPQDYVIDLGSGDGRIVIAAAKRGARALGIEYNPDMVVLSKQRAISEGVTDRARFVQADIFESDFSQATVLTMFLLPELNLRLRPTILDLKPGTRVVSNSFDMAEWVADREVTLGRHEACEGTYCQAFLWIVPAKVEGRWKMAQGELTLQQRFQMVSGTLKTGGESIPLSEAKLTGDKLRFQVGGALYSGQVSGNAIVGTVKTGGNSRLWQASRLGK
jgi:SAM-dependent methyltransferase